MKYGLVLALFLIGCSSQAPQPQAKRIWVMSEMNHVDFTVKEDNGTSDLKMLNFCTGPVPLWQGLHADIVVTWNPDGMIQCYRLDKVTLLK
jgi:hypothetical protein